MAQRLMLVLALATASGAFAQVLQDPTRPPSASPSVQDTKSESSRLQSVLISPGRKLAVIDGRTVTLGERVGDARVVAIAPAQVILQRGAEYQTLKLHPGIEKKP
jgi:MSHA biogenesis protein MshK